MPQNTQQFLFFALTLLFANKRHKSTWIFALATARKTRVTTATVTERLTPPLNKTHPHTLPLKHHRGEASVKLKEIY